MREIERKYLVSDDSFITQAVSSQRIAQGYLTVRRVTARVRIYGDKGYITFKGKDGKDADYERRICDIIERDGLSPDELVFDGECPVFDKYDEYVPPELLREAYALDRLCPEEVVNRFLGEPL